MFGHTVRLVLSARGLHKYCMRLAEFIKEDNNETDDLVPYESKIPGGHLTVGPYTNDWDPNPAFKDVDNILRRIDKQIAAGNVRTEIIPTRKLLATQSWINQDEAGAGDPVIAELEDYPVVALLSDGFYHIIDGHHRCDKAASAKKAYIKAYVFTL
jgi:hypothetical protein